MWLLEKVAIGCSLALLTAVCANAPVRAQSLALSIQGLEWTICSRSPGAAQAVRSHLLDMSLVFGGQTAPPTEQELTGAFSHFTIAPGTYAIGFTLPPEKSHLKLDFLELFTDGGLWLTDDDPVDTSGNYIERKPSGDLVMQITAEDANPYGDGTDYWIRANFCPASDDQPTDDGPKIAAVTLPTTQTVGEKNLYDVDFTGATGGANAVEVDFQIFNPLSQVWFSVNRKSFGAASRGLGTESEGRFPITSVCMRPSDPYRMRLVYTLRDNAGDTSEPYPVEFTCAARATPPPPGTGVASRWTGVWESEALGRVSLYQEEGNELVGGFAGAPGAAEARVSAMAMTPAGVLRGTLSSDGTTFSGTWYQEPSFSGEDTGSFTLTLASDGGSFSGPWRSAGGTLDVVARSTRAGETPGADPQITGLDLPATFEQNEPTVWTIHFSDPQGDIVYIRFEQFANGTWQTSGAGDPDVRGKTQGTITVRTTCTQPGTVRSRIQLQDEAGNLSVAREYGYDCLAGGPPDGSPSVARALDINANGVLDDAEVRVAVQLWILGQPVPGTDGTVINDEQVRRLIQMWVLGERVL